MDFKKVYELAQAGNVNAQYNLGLMYYRGDGIDKNVEKSIEWFKKAAKQGDNEAFNIMIEIVEAEYGTEPNTYGYVLKGQLTTELLPYIFPMQYQ